MEANTNAADKRTAVESLNFDAKTIKRVCWEAWEFTIAGPHQVEVTNASYGYLKDDHSYLVGVETEKGAPVPAECECPADRHREADCKHKLALATVAGPTVLNAAVEAEHGGGESAPFPQRTSTAADKLQPDDGTATCPNGETWCDGPEGDDLPCFPCFDPR